LRESLEGIQESLINALGREHRPAARH